MSIWLDCSRQFRAEEHTQGQTFPRRVFPYSWRVRLIYWSSVENPCLFILWVKIRTQRWFPMQITSWRGGVLNINSCHMLFRGQVNSSEFREGGEDRQPLCFVCDEWRQWHESTRVTGHTWGPGNSIWCPRGWISTQCLGSLAPSGPTFGPWRKARECLHTISCDCWLRIWRTPCRNKYLVRSCISRTNYICTEMFISDFCTWKCDLS